VTTDEEDIKARIEPYSSGYSWKVTKGSLRRTGYAYTLWGAERSVKHAMRLMLSGRVGWVTPAEPQEEPTDQGSTPDG